MKKMQKMAEINDFLTKKLQKMHKKCLTWAKRPLKYGIRKGVKSFQPTCLIFYKGLKT